MRAPGLAARELAGQHGHDGGQPMLEQLCARRRLAVGQVDEATQQLQQRTTVAMSEVTVSSAKMTESRPMTKKL